MAATTHLFVVGVSRSGTTLMRRILNRSTQVALCDENFFLGHLISREGMRHKFRRFAPLSEDANVGRLVSWLYSPEFFRYSRFRKPNWQWRWFLENIDRETMERRLLAGDRSDRAVFSLLMDLFAEAQGAEVRGEKTPAHVRHISTIMAWYPQGRVIHMMRDPRAIYASEVRRRRANPETVPGPCCGGSSDDTRAVVIHNRIPATPRERWSRTSAEPSTVCAAPIAVRPRCRSRACPLRILR